MCHDNLENAIELIKDSLVAIQNEFDEYQNRCFPSRTPEFFCLELNGEAGELANLEKKRWKGKSIEKEQIADEAADVLIALMNYCNAANINIGNAVKLKLLKIETKRKHLEENGESY